jgi:hypothetical protein
MSSAGEIFNLKIEIDPITGTTGVGIRRQRSGRARHETASGGKDIR